MRLLYLFVACIALYSCQQQSPEEKIENLSGYWEINNVHSEHVDDKEYTFNNTVDYIEVDGNNGVRTKLQPNPDGSFTGNKTGENFIIKVENKQLNLYYETPFDEWKETVVRARDNLLVVRNEDGIEYHYKKFEPINLEN